MITLTEPTPAVNLPKGASFYIVAGAVVVEVANGAPSAATGISGVFRASANVGGAHFCNPSGSSSQPKLHHTLREAFDRDFHVFFLDFDTDRATPEVFGSD